ncbi:MAG: hypothetical protein N2039_04455 [Gemmataceae bacterium]|nr:hypothetical protein [Gemmataceae bacterium]
MRRDRVALAVALALFSGWLTWLGWQALRVKRPVVVSAAQLAVAQYDVECDLSSEPLPSEIEVRSVGWSSDGAVPSGRIRVENLRDSRGYAGPGTYLVPLVRRGETYRVAGLPDDPGGRPRPEAEHPRIYPLTAAVRRQWEHLRGLAASR